MLGFFLQIRKKFFSALISDELSVSNSHFRYPFTSIQCAIKLFISGKLHQQKIETSITKVLFIFDLFYALYMPKDKNRNYLFAFFEKKKTQFRQRFSYELFSVYASTHDDNKVINGVYLPVQIATHST